MASENIVDEWLAGASQSYLSFPDHRGAFIRIMAGSESEGEFTFDPVIRLRWRIL